MKLPLRALIHLSLLLVAGTVQNAQAIEVSRYDSGKNLVWLANVPTGEWKIEDTACIYQGANLLGCGTISALTKASVAVRLQDRKSNIFTGDVVSLKKNYRSPATTESVSERMESSVKKSTVDLALGMSAGFNYYFPMAQIQFAVSRDFSLGIMPAFASYSQNNSSVSFFGAFLTGTYYYTHHAFKGVNFEGGLGMYSIKASAAGISESKSPLAMKATAGWRGRALVGAPIDLGVSGGFQYVFSSQSPLNTTFEGFLPILSAFVAYCF